MQKQVMVSQSEQYQMNGALIGLLVGLGSGLIIFGGIGGAIMGGVFGLFGGTVLGAASIRLNHTAGRVLIGLVVLILAVVLVQNIVQDVSSFIRRTTAGPQDPSQIEFDEQYYLDEQQGELR